MTNSRTYRREFLRRVVGSVLGALAVPTFAWWRSSGVRAGSRPPLRPPGALNEAEFLATCIRCGRCADACPNRCITAFTEAVAHTIGSRPGPGEWGTPAIFPRRQACILCQGAPGSALACTAACPTGALRYIPKHTSAIRSRVRMGVARVDRRICYSYNGSSCGVCVRACPLEGAALSAGTREIPVIDPAQCVGCGLCERACIRYPQAIRVVPRGASA